MPGNPMPEPIKDLKKANFSYTPEDGWGFPPVTSAPKAVFNATSMPSLALKDLSGYLNGYDNLSIDSYPNETIPDGSGERGWRIRHAAQPDPYSDNNRELRYGIGLPTIENAHHIKIHQPLNFYHRKCVAINGDLSDAMNWQNGDEIQGAYGDTAKFFAYIPDSEDGEVIVLEDYTGQFAQAWGSGAITNLRNGESFESVDSHNIGANNKLFHEWVDGEYGYPNASLKMEYDAAGNGNSKIKPSISQAYVDGDKKDPRQLSGNEAPGKGDEALIFDREDNGFDVELVFYRRRSETTSSNDGAMELWKLSHNPQSSYASWAPVYIKTGLSVWGDNSLGEPNLATVGYIFGAANSGFTEETDIYLKSWSYWTSKPDFLAV